MKINLFFETFKVVIESLYLLIRYILKDSSVGTRGCCFFILPSTGIGGVETVNLNVLDSIDYEKIVFIANKSDGLFESEFHRKSDLLIHIENAHYFVQAAIILLYSTVLKPRLVFLTNAYSGYLSLPYFDKIIPKIDVIHGEMGIIPFIVESDKFINCRVVVSNSIKEKLGRQTNKPEKIKVIVNGVSANQNIEFPGLDFLKVCYLGRFTFEKRPSLFLEIAEKLKSEKRIKFLMIGSGDLLDSCKESASQKSLNIQFYGGVNQPEAMSLVSDCQILVLPSLSEGLPVVVLEAMSKGLIVLASEVGGVAEIIDNGVDGFSFVSFDKEIEKISDLILDILNNSKSYRTIRDNAVQKIDSNFSVIKMQSEYSKLFSRLIAQ